MLASSLILIHSLRVTENDKRDKSEHRVALAKWKMSTRFVRRATIDGRECIQREKEIPPIYLGRGIWQVPGQG